MRETGYYWIKILKDACWEIAEYNDVLNTWIRIGDFNNYKDEDFYEMRKTKIENLNE